MSQRIARAYYRHHVQDRLVTLEKSKQEDGTYSVTMLVEGGSPRDRSGLNEQEADRVFWSYREAMTALGYYEEAR